MRTIRFSSPRTARKKTWSAAWPIVVRAITFNGRRSGAYLRVGSRCIGIYRTPRATS